MQVHYVGSRLQNAWIIPENKCPLALPGVGDYFENNHAPGALTFGKILPEVQNGFHMFTSNSYLSSLNLPLLDWNQLFLYLEIII
jgi:hypothetical protein